MLADGATSSAALHDARFGSHVFISQCQRSGSLFASIDGGTMRHAAQLSHCTHCTSTFAFAFGFDDFDDVFASADDASFFGFFGFFGFFARFADFTAAGVGAAVSAPPFAPAPPSPIPGAALRAVATVGERFRFTPFALLFFGFDFFISFVYAFSSTLHVSVHHVASSQTHWSESASAFTDDGSARHSTHCSHWTHSVCSSAASGICVEGRGER